MLNMLVVLYTILFSNFGLSIIVFTVIVRLATLPLTLKQLRQMRAMTALQPKMRELQTRYAKDSQRRSQEIMRLYREEGVKSPRLSGAYDHPATHMDRTLPGPS